MEKDIAAPTGEKFVIGSDHAGYELKEKIKRYLAEKKNTVQDLSGELRKPVDWGPVAERVCKAVVGEQRTYGILICGTGLAMSMAANKVRGARAVVLYDTYAAECARRHNDANVLVFGGRTMDFEDACRHLETFFSCDFAGGKYARRNEYLEAIEGRECRGADLAG
ncbi:MAG: ribose 5-phosphate isomerase B [Candidatus Brocadiae bacterium]|nr:ribose 5-phosphate isomerase B [Candidatus Brocadiia bacterium]